MAANGEHGPVSAVVRALRVTFPTGRALLLGNAGAAPLAEVRVCRKGTAWRLDMAGAALSASAEPGGGRRDHYGCVFVRPLAPSARPRSEHAILDAELLLIEGHSEGTSLPARWELAGATDGAAGGSTSGAAAILPNVAGACWIVEGGARLTIGVIPRNFLDAKALSGAAAVHTQIGDAVEGLRRIVDDLIGAQVSIAEGAALRQHAPSVATRLDARTALEGAVQRLHRLNHLLRDGHVLGAWDALIADPAVLLQAEHPARPMAQARQPVLHGNRGPWALASGWSEENQAGRVLDRRVIRTVDTPPNRLAVQLANRVIVELRGIDKALASHVEEEGGGRGLGMYAYADLVRDLMRRAIAVERAPVFAEVSRTAPVALDSPTLQLNRRCQPLLRAWTRLDRGLRADQDIPADEAVLRPLEKTNVLYELWCAVRLRDLLSEALGSAPSHYSLDEILRYDWEVAGARVLLAATMRPRSEVDADEREPCTEEDQARWQSETDRAGGCVQIGTKALVRLPDGLLAVRPKSADRWIVTIWDAKYRTIRDDKYLAGATYQAHAFRDALRVRIDRAAAVQPAWSVVLHPTRIGGADRLIPWSDDAGKEAGVGIVTCRPTDAEDPGLCDLVQRICSRAK